MIRLLCPYAVLLFSVFAADVRSAEPGTDPESRKPRALAVNAAMQEAKDYLAQNRPKDAVAALEKQIIFINGNPTFLALLRDAYIAYLKQGPTDRLEHVKRQLKILDPKLNIDEIVAKAKSAPAVEITAKPIPAPAVEVAQNDPFQQTPLDRQATQAQPTAKEFCEKARSAFEHKHYAEAAAFFAQAVEAGMNLNPEEQTAWGYCRLHSIMTQITKAGNTGRAPGELEREAQTAMLLGGETLQKFGQDVLAAIRKRQGAGPSVEAVPEGWQSIESANFRIIFRSGEDQQMKLVQKAEELRNVTFKKWSGAAAATWASRCDIHLHPSASEYAQATKKSPDSPGHSSVGVKGSVVMARRIDLRSDDPGLLELTLPHEIAYVVLTDMFAEQPLPRWADVGMTTLAQPGLQVSRYVRAVPKMAQDGKLFKVADLLKMTDYPAPARITPFYVESVSLVDYLVKLKGPQTFTLYLREAPDAAMKRRCNGTIKYPTQLSWKIGG